MICSDPRFVDHNTVKLFGNENQSIPVIGIFEIGHRKEQKHPSRRLQVHLGRDQNFFFFW